VGGIACQDLRKAYGDVKALDEVSFAGEAGRVLALLGPNGSGKTTTVRILTTLTAPDSGWARVADKDVVREASSVREAIGLTAQETVIDRFLTGKEYMGVVAQLRHVPRRSRAQEIARLLTEFELDEVSQTRVGSLSGGMRRRLDIAASLLGRPSVLFLDEPSSGLDPHSRKCLWDAIRRHADDGATVLLTTPYMEEADVLADLVVVLARGQVIATGTPTELKDDIERRVLALTLADPDQARKAAAILAVLGLVSTVGETPETLDVLLLRSGPPLLAILQRLDTEGVGVSDVIVRRPTLDEAFLRLVGQIDAIPEDEPEEAPL
jgi:ABC-type multidrug transport system ATPase subunit